MSKMLTHVRFSTQAAYLAKEAISWSADVLTPPEDNNRPMGDWAMERFLSAMRERLDRLEAWHNEASASFEQITTPGGDGCYCTHHPDDPAHGHHCYKPTLTP